MREYSNDKIKNFVEKEKKKETPEYRKNDLIKYFKEYMKDPEKALINTPQSFGQKQVDTSGKKQDKIMTG